MKDLSKELVIALTAPIGVDLEKIEEFIKEILPSPYESEPIRLSSFFENREISKSRIEIKNKIKQIKSKNNDEKIKEIITFINSLPNNKKDTTDSFLKIIKGNLCVAEENLNALGGKEAPILNNKMGQIAIETIKKKQKNAKEHQIYLIRSLKRPEEIEILKRVYGRAFYVLGVFSDNEQRFKHITKKLQEEKIENFECKARELMRQDENEEYSFGQKVQKTFPKADYFVRYDLGCPEKARYNIKRFLDLILNDQKVTPRKEEMGMCYAFVASRRSGDLSRQVGAAIVDEGGSVLSVGTNEVPKAGGDQYWEEDETRARDIERGEDANDKEKIKIAKDFVNELIIKINEKRKKDRRVDPTSITEELINEILEKSKLDNLLEFGRAIHAETDVIVSAARRGVAIKDSILYSTTFPCHLCIKNIIDAGIKTVVYVYPYPKSQAYALHEDALAMPPKQGTVLLRPYEGVSPIRFFDLFSMIKRKDDKTGNACLREEPEPRLKRDPRGERNRERNP